MKALSLVVLAREDIASSQSLLASGIPRPAAYHLSQAVEKLIKAILEVEGTGYPATSHRIDDLIGRLPSDHLWFGDLQPFGKYGAASTVMRYPTATGDVPRPPDAKQVASDVKELASIIDEIEAWCRERLA